MSGQEPAAIAPERQPRLLVYGLNHAPELTGVGFYTGDMAAWLHAAGFPVEVVTAHPYYPDWRVAEGHRAWSYRREVRDGVPVRRCPVWVPARPTMPKRLLHLASFALFSAPVVLWRALRTRPDLIWTTEPSIFGAPAAVLAARLSGAHCWLHVQDIELVAVARLDLIKGRLLQRAVLAGYRWLLRRFDTVSTISETMAGELRALGVRETVMFRNWVDVDGVTPDADPTRLRRELDLPATPHIALYSGNLGAKQGVETLVEAARHLAHRPDVHFLICGAGAMRLQLEAAAAELPNVSLRPLQPFDRLNELLNLASVHLLPQRRGATLFAMPSKLSGMLASGKAVVAQAEPDTEFARLLKSCAVVVPPEDAAATATAVERLVDAPAECARLGAAGRRFALATLARDAILGRFATDLRHRLDPAAQALAVSRSPVHH